MVDGRGVTPESASSTTTSDCGKLTEPDGTVQFHLPYGEWVRLFRDSGLVIEDLLETLRTRCGAARTAAKSWPGRGGGVACAAARRGRPDARRAGAFRRLSRRSASRPAKAGPAGLGSMKLSGPRRGQSRP